MKSMFSWLRRKQDAKFFADVMRAAAEGDKISRLRRAFSTLNTDLANEKENGKLAAKASIALLEEIKSKNATVTESTYIFIDGVFILVFTNHFSFILMESFEMISILCFLEYFGVENGPYLISKLTEQYNELSVNSPMIIQSIGDACATWSNTPNTSSLDNLKNLYSSYAETLQ